MRFYRAIDGGKGEERELYLQSIVFIVKLLIFLESLFALSHCKG